MSVIGGVLLFTAGVLVGGGAVAYNRLSIERATDKLRRENNGLKEHAWETRLSHESDLAYNDGFRAGRKHPIHAVEEFADMLDKHNTTVKLRR